MNDESAKCNKNSANSLYSNKSVSNTNVNNNNNLSPDSSFLSASSINLLLGTNNLVIDEDYQSNCEENYSTTAVNSILNLNENILNDTSPTTGNYGNLIDLKKNLVDKKYSYKFHELSIAKLKQKKLKEQLKEQQAQKQASVDIQQKDYQKHDYYEIYRKLKENLRKQKLFFQKSINLLNSELKIKIITENLNRKFNLSRNSNQSSITTTDSNYSCKPCDCQYEKIENYLNHLYSDQHLDYLGGLGSTSTQTFSNNNNFVDELKLFDDSTLKGNIIYERTFFNSKLYIFMY